MFIDRPGQVNAVAATAQRFVVGCLRSVSSHSRRLSALMDIQDNSVGRQAYSDDRVGYTEKPNSVTANIIIEMGCRFRTEPEYLVSPVDDSEVCVKGSDGSTLITA